MALGFIFILAVASIIERASGLATAVTKGTIVGGGRIGGLLHELNGGIDQLITRDSPEKIAAGVEGPIYVCTRNNDLEKIIEDCPEDRRCDLIFLQNGILTEYLKGKGLEDNTQGLVYFAVSKKGEAPIDGKTDTNPEGLTAVTGKWGNDMAARLAKADLACKVLDKEPWTIAMLEKHIWICAFMAVGSQYEGCTVGGVEGDHNAEVRDIINELAAAASWETGLSFSEDLGDRLCAYARSVSHFPTALKEFEWRNGWFADITLKRAGRMMTDLSPKHTSILSNDANNLFFKAKKAYVERLKEEALQIAPAWYGAKDAAEVAAGERALERLQKGSPKIEAGSAESRTKSPTILGNDANTERMLKFIEYKRELEALEK
jgi:hypothetical protein